MANNPPKRQTTVAILIFFMLLCLFLIAAFISGWPPSEDLFFRKLHLKSEQKLIFLVAIGGALGAFVHVATSFTDYLGSKQFEKSWISWYLMRPFIGATLALSFYFLLRGGLINVNVDSPQLASQYSAAPVTDIYIHVDTATGISLRSSSDTLAGFRRVGVEKLPVRQDQMPINPFGVTAVAILAGLFSRQAVDKLREIFETLFLTKEKVDRADPLVERNSTSDVAANEVTGSGEISDEEPVG